MAKLLDKSDFGIEINKYNPNGITIFHVDVDENGKPFDMTYIYANEAIAELEGMRLEDIIGRRFFADVFPGRSLDRLMTHYDAAYLGKVVSYDDVSDELRRYMHVDVFPTGRPGYCISVLGDIEKSVLERVRERKRLEVLVGELEDERRINLQIKDYAAAMGMVYPLAVNMDYKNDSYRMIEYDNFINKTAARSGDIDEFIRVGATTVPDPDVAKEFWRIFNRQAIIDAFAAGKKEVSLRHPQNGDDGRVHYMDTKVICTEYSDERIEGIALSRCVDGERERELALETSIKRAEIIDALATIYSTIMEADLKTHKFRSIKAVSSLDKIISGPNIDNFDEVVNAVTVRFIHPDMIEHMREFLDLSTLSERLENTDTVLTEFKNPRGKWFEARFIAQKRDENGHAVSALYVARDINEEKVRELDYREQLKATAIEAEKANISKTNFLRRMSHDIRTPLNGITGMLHIAKRQRANGESIDDCLEKIQHSTDYLLSIVNNVLDISKLESGSLNLEHKPFDMMQLLQDTLPTIDTNAKENGIELLDGHAEINITHRYVVGSPVHLNRVLMNIASNAIKYNRPGGYLKLYCNELACDGEGATYEIVCEDSGLGMSEEFQKHAFEPFSHEGKETTTSFSGSGLGLSIVRDIVELMGGTVELKSKENVGTTIKVLLTLPLDREHGRAETAENIAEDVDVSGRRALLVEDNDLNMEIARVLLEEMGLVITEAKNGSDAVDTFKNSEPNTFDFIFMDMMMPVMDGIEATKEIRALPREDAEMVPIIAMTANAFAEDRKLCIDAGMNDHIGKPIETKALREIVNRYAR